MLRGLLHQIPNLSQALPGYHRSQARVHLWREADTSSGQQQCPGHAQADRGVPHRFQVAGKISHFHIFNHFFAK